MYKKHKNAENINLKFLLEAIATFATRIAFMQRVRRNFPNALRCVDDDDGEKKLGMESN